jgi:asparagine synthase (glutamine-hydrolysing)
MTMATSVELRVPLLDSRILEYAAKLPQRYKVSGWQLKRVLKAALGRSVPREIINRRKTGFPVPYAEWMRKDLKEFVFDTVLAKNAACDCYFRKPMVSKLLQAHQRAGGYGKEVFCLLVLELWHRQFTGSSSPSR